MSNILLINTRPTRDYTTFEADVRVERYFNSLEARGPKMGDTRTEPNNGLLIIGKCLKHAGHRVEYLDLSADEFRRFLDKDIFYSFEEMCRRVEERARDFDFLFFSAIVVGIDDTLRLMDFIKQKHPDKIVVLGGTFPTLRPDYCLEHSNGIDVLVLGEGEAISSTIVDAYSRQSFEQLEKEIGIYYRKDNHADYKRREGFNLIDLEEWGDLSKPDWSLLDLSAGPHVYRVMTARGCGFHCSFCVPSYMSSHKVRLHRKQDIIKAIKDVKERYHSENYVIGDLTFLYDQEYGRDILETIIEEKIALPFWCQTHLSRVNEQNLELLQRAGCSQLAVGIESINPSILKNINKGIDEREIIKKLLLIKEYGIEVQTYFIIGLPGDDLETVKLNKRFIEYGVASGYIDRTHIGVYVPYPGVPKDKTIEIKSQNYACYTQGVFRDIPAEPVFSSNTISKKEVKEAFYDCLGGVGDALGNGKKSMELYDSFCIILGAEALSVLQNLKKISHETKKIPVFNIVQGIREKGRAFVSTNIQEVHAFVYGNAEVYNDDEAAAIVQEVDGEVEIILVDGDIKTPGSKNILSRVRTLAKKSKLLFYSDIQTWVRTVLNIVLAEKEYDLFDIPIYITPENRFSHRLKVMLEDFGAKVFFESEGSQQVFDIVISFGIEGTPLEHAVLDQLRKGGILIDAAIGTLDERAYEIVSQRGISVYRPDMRTLIALEVFQGLEVEKFVKQSVGVKILDGIRFISGGVMGRKNDVVVDSITKPKTIIGIADGKGGLIPRNQMKEKTISLFVKANKILEKET